VTLVISRRTVVLVLIAGTLAATGVAYATIPDASGVITGCYRRFLGGLRVIDPGAGERCGPLEIALQWNQTGPQGPQGVPGEAGAPGISGYEIVSRSQDRDANPGTGGGSVYCPPGKVPLGGGADVTDPEDDDGSFFSAGTVEMSRPHSDAGGVGWAALFRWNFELAVPVPVRTTVYAVCAFVDG
jgi:hypothetical protein